MGRPQASFAKRQRERAKKEKKAVKAEKREQRRTDSDATGGPPMLPPQEPVLPES